MAAKQLAVFTLLIIMLAFEIPSSLTETPASHSEGSFNPPQSPGQCPGPTCGVAGGGCRCDDPCDYLTMADPCTCERDWDCYHLSASFGGDQYDTNQNGGDSHDEHEYNQYDRNEY